MITNSNKCVTFGELNFTWVNLYLELGRDLSVYFLLNNNLGDITTSRSISILLPNLLLVSGSGFTFSEMDAQYKQADGTVVNPGNIRSLLPKFQISGYVSAHILPAPISDEISYLQVGADL